MRGSRQLPFLLFGTVLLVIIGAASAGSVSDPDLWGHLRFGQDIVASRAIPVTDPYSFTQDVPWTNHEWLAEVSMALAYRLAGAPGLLLLPLFAMLGTVVVGACSLRRSGVGEPLSVLLLAVLLLGIASQLTVVRPQLFSIVSFAALVAVCNGLRAGRSSLVLWLMPIFALWSNLHGGWIVGLGTLGLLMGVGAVRREVRWPLAMSAVLLATASTLVNPYGWGLWLFLKDTVGLGRPDIQDWQPLIRTPTQLVPWAMGCAVVLFAVWRKGLASLLTVVPTVVLGIMALRVVRLNAFFVTAAVLSLAPLLSGVGPRSFRLSRPPARGELLAVGGLFAAALAAGLYALVPIAMCLPIEGEKPVLPEREAVVFARQNNLRGRVLSWFDYGEYAIWHLSPTLKVSYDGRRETVYSERVRNSHLRFYRGDEPRYPSALAADYVWLPKDVVAVEQLPARGWVPIFQGSRSVIFARQPGAYQPVKAMQGPRCFPGP